MHHVVWFRRDLRLGDNPAWAAATQQADEVTALFVLDPALFTNAGPHRQEALVAHLRGLDTELRERGGRLRVEHGKPLTVLPQIVDEVGAGHVHWNRDTTPYSVTRDDALARQLSCTQHWGTLVHEPGAVLTQKGTLSKVFTPFYNTWYATAMHAWPTETGDVTVAANPGPGLPDVATPLSIEGGEQAAHRRLGDFMNRVDNYLGQRDLLAVVGTSMLSADLRFGTLSPREVADIVGEQTEGRRGFVRQLAWRDWYAHLLYQHPTMTSQALKPQYNEIVWRDDPAGFDAWKHGQTGFPIIDAGMRELAATGYMHNRVRMLTGSFLVKDLLIDWRLGERWFRHLLLDADMSQNVGNWQWVAGTGTDAAPYFRVFNPTTQSRKFDPAGGYLRRWVPELAGLDDKAVHEPSIVAPLELAAAGVVLGDNYPHPIVDHSMARERVLTAYKQALAIAPDSGDVQ